VYSAFDIASLCTPFGEGFPNTVGEAMACGAPCVVTPAGDSALIVDDTGMVVKAGSPEELAAGWKRMLALSDSELAGLKERARVRIRDRYRKELMVASTEQALLSL
jgi:glycosyltransferase involved in cell wall biosynthesis